MADDSCVDAGSRDQDGPPVVEHDAKAPTHSALSTMDIADGHVGSNNVHPLVEQAGANDQDTQLSLPHRRQRRGQATNVRPEAVQLLGAGLGWLALLTWKRFKRQQRVLKEVTERLDEAESQLKGKEEQVQQLEQSLRASQEKEWELSSSRHQLLLLQEELQSATRRWHEAAGVLEKTMSDLQSSKEELGSARDQLQGAFVELRTSHDKLASTEGELGLTRSENELLKRELQKIRRQLEQAQDQMHRYHMESQRSRGHAVEDHWD